MYTTTTIKHKKTDQLDALARESGRCYSKALSIARKLNKQKGFWISEKALKAWFKCRGFKLHSQTVQGCIESYRYALKSYFAAKKVNEDAKPPKRTPKFYKVLWKSSAIRIKNGQMILSNGRGQEPVILDGITEKPDYVEMHFKRGHYYFALVYKVNTPEKKEIGITVSVDMGEIHPIVSFDGSKTTLYNSRFLRSIQRYRNKFLSQVQSAIDICPKGSRKWRRLIKSKRRTLEKINAQIRDAEHKITSRFISDCQRVKADTIVIGDLKGIRENIKYGKKSNQKLHQWAFSRIAQLITYKAEMVGIKVVSEDEAYTSQTCPQCGHRKKPTNRNYKCSECSFEYHRDGVGAINIWKKVSGILDKPFSSSRVFGKPLGVRFNWHLSSLGLTRNFAISEKRTTEALAR